MEQHLNDDLPNLGRGRSCASKAGQKNWLDGAVSLGRGASDAKAAAAFCDASGYQDLSQFGYLGVGRQNRLFALRVYMKALTCMSATMISHDFMRFSCCKLWSTAWKSGFAFGAAPDLRVTETASFGDGEVSTATGVWEAGAADTSCQPSYASGTDRMITHEVQDFASKKDAFDEANSDFAAVGPVQGDCPAAGSQKMNAYHTTCLRDVLALLGTPTPEDDAFCAAHFWDSGCDFLGGPLGPEFGSADTGLHDALTLLGKPISAAETVGAISACEFSKNSCHRDTTPAPFQALRYSDPFSACGSAGAAILDEGSDFLGNPICTCTTTCAAASWSEGPAHSWDAGTDFLGGPLCSFMLPSQDHRDIGSSMIATKNDEQDPQRAKTQSSGSPTPRGLLERRPVQGPRFTVSGPPALEATLETRPEKGQRSHEMSFPNLFPNGAPTSSPERAPMSCHFASQCDSHGITTVAGCPGLLAEVLACDDFCWKESFGATEAVRGESLSHLACQHVAGGVSGVPGAAMSGRETPVYPIKVYRAPCTSALTAATRELDYNHLHGCRIGEASHPGPGAVPLGGCGVLLRSLDVLQVHACKCPCDAMLGDASVITWGRIASHCEYQVSSFAPLGFRPVLPLDCCAVQVLPRDVQQVYASKGVCGAFHVSECAFAVILGDASVITWGHACSDAKSSGVQHQSCLSVALRSLLEQWLEFGQDCVISARLSSEILPLLHAEQGTAIELAELIRLRDMSTKPPMRIFGGDGWANNIGCGGIETMAYQHVYVASVAIGANDKHCVEALAGAEKYEGPALLIYYVPCIEHRIFKTGLSAMSLDQRDGVKCGFWPLYGFNLQIGDNSFILDSKQATGDVMKYLNGQNRCAQQTQPVFLADPEIVDDECYCMLSELSLSTIVQSFRAHPDSDAKAYVNSKLCSCSGMRCKTNVIGCFIQLVASHIHQATDVDGENGSGLSVINSGGNNGYGIIADCSPCKRRSRSDMRCTANVFDGRTQVVAPHIHQASDFDGEHGSGLPVINFCGNNCYGMIADCSPCKRYSRSGMHCTANVFGGRAQLVASHMHLASDVNGENDSDISVINFSGNNGPGMIADCSPCKLCSRSGMHCTAHVFGGRTQLVASHMHLASDVNGENDSGLSVINFSGNNGPGTIADCSPCKRFSCSDMRCTANVFGGRTQVVAPHIHQASDFDGENDSGLSVINFCGNNSYGMFADCGPCKLCSRSGMHCTANVFGGRAQLVASHMHLASDVNGENDSDLLVINFRGNNGPGMIADCSPCKRYSRSDMRCTANVFGGRTQVVAPHIHQASDIDGEHGSGLPVINFCGNNCYGMIADCSPCKLCIRSGMQCTANVFGGRTQLVASHMHLASDVHGENGSGLPVINFSGNNCPGMIADCSPYKPLCVHYKNRAAVKSMIGNFIDGQNVGFTLRSRLCYHMFSELSFNTPVQSLPAYPDSGAKTFVDCKLCSENGSGPPVINFCGNNGHGMTADCSPCKSPCARFQNRVPIQVPLIPCADGDLATFRFRLCPFGFRCWMLVFNSACQVACSPQHSISQVACEVSCDHVSPRLDAHATHGLNAFTIVAQCAPCMSALTEAMHELDHNHLHACRIGEASHPGPGVTSQLSFLGPEFAKQIQAQIEAAVQAAVMQALRQLNIPGLAAGAMPATRPHSQGDVPMPAGGPGPKKRQRKRKKKVKDAAAIDASVDVPPQPARRVVVAGDDAGKARGHRPDAGGRGKGKGNPKPNQVPPVPDGEGWQLVRPKSRRDQDGEFALRAEDWSAPIVEFSKLAAFLDGAKPGTTLEAVVYIKPDQKEVASNLIRGAGAPYKFLLIYLDKKDGVRTPGLVDGRLVFRQAVVIQLSSDKNFGGVPQPKGINATAVKIQPATETAVLFMKVYKNFASADFWKRFGSNPNRSLVQWASQHRMRVLDTFSWAIEKGRADVGELFGGMARVRKTDLEAFLQLSGTQGIFIDTARRHGVQSKVTWIDRTRGETPSAYHERALRQGSDLGLVTNANRLGWRKKLAAGETEQRLWQVDGLPFEWDDEIVKQLLESNFGEITIISHRRSRLGQNFRFKAASRQEGRDIVPLVAEGANGTHTTYWATWALPANVSVRRKPLPRTAVPVAQIPELKTVTAPCKQGSMQNAEPKDDGTEGKPVPEAKRSKQEVRALPDDLSRTTVPTDGSCLFHAVSKGLQWLKEDRDAHPRILRAETIDHMRRHAPTYEAEWDHKGPDGCDFSGSFEDYLTIMEQPTSYATDVEFKALARVLDLKLVVIPAGTHWHPMCFHHRTKRLLVLWYDALHIDLLLPKDGATKYPDSYVQITAGPTGGLRAGGVGRPPSVFTAASSSQVCRASAKTKPRSVFTTKTKPASVFTASSFSQVRASAQVSGAQGHSHAAASVDAVAAERVLARCTQVPGQVQEAVSDATVGDLSDCDQQALEADGPAVPRKPLQKCAYRPVCPMPSDKIFRCKLCPFQQQVAGPESYKRMHHRHYRVFHGGEGLPGKFRGFSVKRLTAKDGKAFWKCPLCKQGISTQVRDQITKDVFADMRNRHREQRHAKVPVEEWRRLMSMPQKGPKNIAEHKSRARALKLNSRVSEQLQKPKYDGKLTMFLWPKARRHKGKKSICRISFEHAWQCKKCGRCTKETEQAKQHASGRCPKALPDTKKRRLAQLREARAWASKHCEPQERQQVLNTIDAAHNALQEDNFQS